MHTRLALFLPSIMAETLLTLKGVADLLVAGILTLQPSLIYDSFPARTVAAWTGLVSFASLQSIHPRAHRLRICSTCRQQRLRPGSIKPSHAWSPPLASGTSLPPAPAPPPGRPCVSPRAILKRARCGCCGSILTRVRSSCDECYVGDTWASVERDTPGMGFEQRDVVDDEHQPYSVYSCFVLLRSGVFWWQAEAGVASLNNLTMNNLICI